jgi:uncharacterized protein (PEP-CTERM system associated)
MRIQATNRLTTGQPFFLRASLLGALLWASMPAWAQTALPPAGTTTPESAAVSQQSTSQALNFEPAVSAELVISDNGNFGIGQEKKSEVSAIISPRLGFRRQTPDFRLDGSVGLTAYTYANDTREDTVLPRLDVLTQATLIRDWMTLQASVQTRDFLLDTLSAENQGGLTASAYNAIQSRVLPALSHEFSAGLKFDASSENSWTTYSGDNTDQLAESYAGEHKISLAQTPAPFGWFLRASRNETKYDVLVFDRFVTDLASAGVEYTFGGNLTVGLGAGQENNQFPEFSAKGDTALVSLRWRPASTTSIEAEGEKRFFGNTWRLDAAHRSALLAFNFGGGRQLEAFQEELLALPRAGTTAALIDQILAARIADPAQRAQAVQDLINRRGLPGQIDQASSVYSERIRLVQSVYVSMGLLGARNSIVLSANRERVSDVPQFNDVLASAGLSLQNGLRTGVNLAWNHRVSPTRSVDTQLALFEAEEQSTAVQRRSRQSRLQAVYSLLLSPRSVMTLGVRFQRYVLDGADPSNESALLATFSTRF